MPIKKWVKQYLIALPILFSIFAGVQYFKGRALDYSIEFGVIWALVAISIFALTRAFNFRKNKPCAVCNDLPKNE